MPLFYIARFSFPSSDAAFDAEKQKRFRLRTSETLARKTDTNAKACRGFADERSPSVKQILRICQIVDNLRRKSFVDFVKQLPKFRQIGSGARKGGTPTTIGSTLICGDDEDFVQIALDDM